MAVITSHALDSTDGSHASGIWVSIRNVSDGKILAEGTTDEGGRVSFEIEKDVIDPSARYELLFATARYWSSKGKYSVSVIPEIALRFDMPDGSANYHMPVILGPYSYSTWKSG